MFVTFPVHHLVSIRFPLGYSPFSACPCLSPSTCSIRFPLSGKKSRLHPRYLATHGSTPHTKNYSLHSLHSLSLSLSPSLSQVMSTRSRNMVADLLRDIPCWLSAEHGHVVRLSNHSTTIPSTDNDAAPNFKSSSGGWEVVGYQNERGSGLNSPLRLTGQNWFATILQIFHHYGNRTPGAIVETTPVSISLRFEDADKVCLWCGVCGVVSVLSTLVVVSFCQLCCFNSVVALHPHPRPPFTHPLPTLHLCTHSPSTHFCFDP